MARQQDARGEVVRSFYVPGEEGISEFWRRNKSTVVSLELARLMLALRKLIGYIGLNIGSIIWKGMKPPEETSAIIIDPGLVQGKYPVPASKTDNVVGITVREAYRRIEWSEKAEQFTREKAGAPKTLSKQFQKYFTFAEKIYLDLLANRTVLGQYAEVARLNEFQGAKRGFPPPPSLEEFLYCWWLTAAARNGGQGQDGQAAAGQTDSYSQLLSKLSPITDRLQGECLSKRGGVLERCDCRAGIYAELWPEVMDAIKSWPVDDEYDEHNVDDIIADSGYQISEATAQALENALAESIDLTRPVLAILGEKEVVEIRTGRLVMPMEEKLDQNIYMRLKASLRLRSKKRSLISRGLESGSIDPRRLYRASMTGEVFQYKKYVYEMDNDVALLIDASSSMIGPKWKKSQQIFSALTAALVEMNSETRVYAYNEASNTCYITELLREGKLYTIIPRGKTASGEAITATALLLQKQKHRRRPLIIHITDGASNWGGDVRQAVEYCRRQHIGLITLGLGCHALSQLELKQQYGDQVRFVDDIRTLPKKFAELVTATEHLL